MIIGLVGKPSAGKSTFFKASTLADVEIANYPFTTIKPNSGVGYVRVKCACKDFERQCTPRSGSCHEGVRFVPVEIIDVAGLVPGAHEGKGRGNQFLDDLRQADVLIHVIDCSGSLNDAGEPVDQGSYDPCNDIRFLEEELDMWYLGILKKGWEKFARTLQQTHGDIKVALAKQLSGLGVTEEMVEDALKTLTLPEQVTSWSEEQLHSLATLLRTKTKPIVIAANKIDVPGAQEKFEVLKKTFPQYSILPCSAESELALKEGAKHELLSYIPGAQTYSLLKDLSPQQEKALGFIQKNLLDTFGSTGVQDVLDKAIFDVLGYIAIFPGGVSKLEDSEGRVLPDCFLLPPKSTALDFAYKLHTDFGKNFIKAIDVRKKLPVGKDHPLENRDVIEIMAK